DDAPVSALVGRRRPFDWIGFGLIAVSLLCLTYVFVQGNRWDWFTEPLIVWLTALGVATLLLFFARQVLAQGQGLVDFTIFRSEGLSFAFVVSFVAAAAWFGSASLVRASASSVLAFSPTAAGQRLLPSGALFAGAPLCAAYLMQARGVSPITTAPF